MSFGSTHPSTVGRVGIVACLLFAGGLAACDSNPGTEDAGPGNDGPADDAGPGNDSTPTQDGNVSLGQVTTNVKTAITAQLDELLSAVEDLQAAAPEPDADGWNSTDDATATDAMKAAWKRARSAYESVEGAIAVLFPELDESTDQRYDAFIEDNGPDDYLFDGEGVTGVHAIERILWADEISAQVVDYEDDLKTYEAAAFPSTEQEADDFKNSLCQRLVDDVKEMQARFADEALDPYAAYRGIIGSMMEQVEKTILGATGEDESRYAQNTLADMRANLAGGQLIFDAFEPLFGTVAGAQDIADQIAEGFDRIEALYADLGTDSLPEIPAGWNPDAPTKEQLATPYGELFDLLSTESNPDLPGSLVYLMLDLGNALGIPLDL